MLLDIALNLHENNWRHTSCNVAEKVGIMNGIQSLQELLICRGKAIIHLISRRPERIAAGLGKSMHLQDGIIGGSRLECNVRML